MGERDGDWERAHLIGWEWCGGKRCRLEEGALESGSGVDEDTDWERAHLIGWEWCGGERHRLGESALESGNGVGERDADWEGVYLRVVMVWGREMKTGRERT